MNSEHIAIIQARMGSTRFPGKSMVKIVNRPLIWHVINRLKQSKNLSEIYLATPISQENDILEKYVTELGAKVYRGSEDNVFSRFENIVERLKPLTITRVCGDCPLIDPKFIDRAIDIIKKEKVDYVKTDKEKSLHQGVNVVSGNLFNKLIPFKGDPILKEHVLSFSHLKLEPIKKGIISLKSYEHGVDIRLSVDTPSDLKFISELYKISGAKPGKLTSKQVVNTIKKEPYLRSINSHVYQKKAKQKTTKVIFLYNKRLSIKMFELARKYIETEGFGVRFLVKKSDIRNKEFEKNDIGVVSYSIIDELLNVIKNNSTDFIISEKLPDRKIKEMQLSFHKLLSGSLIKYKNVGISTIK